MAWLAGIGIGRAASVNSAQWSILVGCSILALLLFRRIPTSRLIFAATLSLSLGGLRYGISTFKQELLSYQIYDTNQTFPATTITEPVEFSGLTAHWAELIFGIKTEVLPNLYLSINLQLKRKIAEGTPENFNNLFIPGFNRTYDFSEFGAGYGYTVSYLIPIFKK